MRTTGIVPFQTIAIPVRRTRALRAAHEVAPPAPVRRMDAHRLIGEDSARFTLALRAALGHTPRGLIVDIEV